jgi:hypothetical protein
MAIDLDAPGNAIETIGGETNRCILEVQSSKVSDVRVLAQRY